MNKKIIAVVLALIVVLAAVVVVWQYTSGDDKSAEGTEYVDDLGRTVTIEKTPERVLCLGSSFTESMIYLDCFDRIAGVDKSSVTRLQTLHPEVVNLDTIDALKPDTNTVEYCINHNVDFVIAWAYGTYSDGIKLLENAGIDVIGLNPSKMDDVSRIITLLGDIMDKKEKAQSIVNDMENRIETIKTGAMEKAGDSYGSYAKVYVELDTLSKNSGDYASPNSSSITGSMLDILGVDYIGKDASKTQRYQTESIIAYAPDYMVFMGPRNQPESEILRNNTIGPDAPGWSNPNTVISMYTADGEPGFNGTWASATPSLIDGLEFLYDLIYGETNSP